MTPTLKTEGRALCHLKFQVTTKNTKERRRMSIASSDCPKSIIEILRIKIIFEILISNWFKFTRWVVDSKKRDLDLD